jgi:zinc protease
MDIPMRLHNVLAALLLSWAAPGFASVTDVTLDNGLRVIVKEDHRSPVMVSQVWYKAGSLDEENGRTGVAHVLEHMMFKGTPSVPDGQFSKRIAAAGGRDNAFTSRDYTVYFQQMQKDHLPLSMTLEADRMANLVISDEAFKKEIQVVMEERRLRTEDNPQAVVYERLMAAAFQASPYRRPIIGWMGDLQNMTADDARDWYARWYAPDNATLVVAGDVDPQQVIDAARKTYGKLMRRALPVRKPQPEPAQLGIKRIVVKAPAKLPYLLMAWHAPRLEDPQKDWQPWALQILAGVLDGNDSARLKQALVKDKPLAVEVSAGYDPLSRGPGMFLVDATPSEGQKPAVLEAAIRAQLRKIARTGVSEAELTRVKAQVIAAEVYQRDSVFYQAMQLGELATLGLPLDLMEQRVTRLRAVTAEQVREVARIVFKEDALSIAVLDPLPLTGPEKTRMPEGMSHVR